MADFNWNDVPHAKDDSFKWDDHPLVEGPPDKHSAVASGVMHGLQGFTGSFSDELAGLGEAGGRLVGLEGAGGGPLKDMHLAKSGPTHDWETLKDAYHRARDHERQMLKEQSDEHPLASGTGEFAGMLASPLNKLAEGASLIKGGAALGGINALGSSDKEDLKGMALDTAIGAGAGALVGKGVEKASPMIERGAEKLSGSARDLAERFGARALGAERGSIKKMGMDKVKGAASQMLDNGGFSSLASTDDLIARNAALKAKGGGAMGEVYDAIDNAGVSTFHPHDVAESVEKELAPTWRTPINKGETNQFDNTLESILSRGQGDIPIQEAQALKEELGGAANWRNKLNISPKEQMARDAYGVVNGKIDEAADIGAKALNDPGLTEKLAQGKKMFGNASTAENLLETKAAREQGNNLVGLTDAITGVGALGYGATTDDWKTAGGIMVGKKLLQKYGAQNAALGLNKVSKMLMQTPKFAALAEKSPQAFNSLVEKFASRLSSGVGNTIKAAGAPESKQVVDEDEAKNKFIEGN